MADVAHDADHRERPAGRVADPELLATVRALAEQAGASEGKGAAPEVAAPPPPQAQVEAGVEELEVAAQQAGAPDAQLNVNITLPSSASVTSFSPASMQIDVNTVTFSGTLDSDT
ncbi:hypothetical protein L6R53_33740, partial [Myxococcota bacterium]|nr:hypothetical protein [Myxococcota bacterium]